MYVLLEIGGTIAYGPFSLSMAMMLRECYRVPCGCGCHRWYYAYEIGTI